MGSDRRAWPGAVGGTGAGSVAESGLDEARIQQERERILQREPDRGAALGEQTFGRHPMPRSPLSGAERPAGAHVHGSAPGLGADLVADQQAELDAHPGEPDAPAAGLAARGEVVILGQLAAAHAGAVVHDGEARPGGIGHDQDAGRARVQRVGDHFRKDGLL